MTDTTAEQPAPLYGPPDPPHATDSKQIAARTQKAAHRTRIAQRRERVSAALLAGRSYREIAAMITAQGDLGNVSATTIADDVKQIRDGWRERASLSYDMLVGHEVAKLDALERGHMAAAMSGDPAAARIVIRVMERRARLLGLDRPATFHLITTSTTTTKLDESIAEMLAQMAAQDAVEHGETIDVTST
jgi:hypothetical protein